MGKKKTSTKQLPENKSKGKKTSTKQPTKNIDRLTDVSTRRSTRIRSIRNHIKNNDTCNPEDTEGNNVLGKESQTKAEIHSTRSSRPTRFTRQKANICLKSIEPIQSKGQKEEKITVKKKNKNDESSEKGTSLK